MCLLFSCYHRGVLATVTEDYGVDLSLCQVISLTEPDVLPDFSCLANDFAHQSFLIICTSRHLSVILRPETVSICKNMNKSTPLLQQYLLYACYAERWTA